MTKYLPYVLLASALAIPLPVRAEPLAIPLAAYATAAAADLHSTYRFLQFQATRERNPLGAWLSDDPGLLVAHDIAIELGAGWALHQWWGRRHPRWERALLYTAAAARLALALDNYRFAAQLQRDGRPRKGDRYVWPSP